MLRLLALAACVCLPQLAHAELKFSSVFGDSMVLQRDQPIHVWGWTTPSLNVSATIDGHEASATADAEGRFSLKLASMEAGGPYELVVRADQTRTFKDVLIGEVWLCSGQSNMQWSVDQADDGDLESLSANYPNIRLITVPQVAAQTPQDDFNGSWKACTPQTVKDFSAVGYFFGRQLHQTLNVPIGLIDNSWGGSAAEAWVPRDVLKTDGKYDDLIAKWDRMADTYDHDAAVAKWKVERDQWKENGKQGQAPRAPQNQLQGNHRPGNLYNGVLHPVIGYTIAGTVWYQGESNSGRAYQYRDLFPLMIETWRSEWKQGDFPFYWVQLADFQQEETEPSPSTWAELREAQTMTLDRLPATGQAVITDLGEATDIHPKNKQDVAKRLARWAFAKQYAVDVPYQSPTFESMTVEGNKAVLKFSHVGGGLDTFDVPALSGFTIAGEDKTFVHATAKIVDKDTIEVSAEGIESPASVRYAWANNPIANVQSAEGLPMTPFRTDQWAGITADVTK